MLDDYIDLVDMILIMTVEPGFGGQSLIESALDNARYAKALIECSGRSILLEADGGIKAANAGTVADAGVEILVAGSAVFCADNYKTAIEDIRSAATA